MVARCFTNQLSQHSVPVRLVQRSELAVFLSSQTEFAQSWIKNTQSMDEDRVFCVPGEKGELAQAIVCMDDHQDRWALADAMERLPAGDYHLEGVENDQPYFAWGLAAYRFDRYLVEETKNKYKQLRCYCPESLQNSEVIQWVDAVYWVRDLINTPTQDMTTDVLLQQAKQLAKQFSAKFQVWTGKQLLKEFPAVEAVGRGAKDPSYFAQFEWGSAKHLSVALVGKGVCFDTGGLDLKSAAGMLQMKKDMGGAANMLGLAKMIMQQKLPIHLTVYLPIVENAISDHCYRPGDVLQTRKGLSVEVTNTDAEGRLILADALAKACEAKPDYLFDFATLTGANYIALGGHIASMFTKDQQLGAKLAQLSIEQDDLVWPMPLHQPYLELLKSDIADIANAAKVGRGGSITAALFLQQFVSDEQNWTHFDISAWNFSERPGRPEGAEATAIRTVYQFLKGLVNK